jgi:formate hydrogenlyase subunit 6/NADH:ubiquinone oxidoreductase subunit I
MEVESGSPPHDAALDRDESPGPKVSGTRIERFEIDMSRCFHCGLCEEVCPADALVMSPLFEIASSDAENLIFDLDSLLVPAHLLPRQLELRGAGAVSGFPAEKGAG